jgi:hypothetical protein
MIGSVLEKRFLLFCDDGSPVVGNPDLDPYVLGLPDPDPLLY